MTYYYFLILCLLQHFSVETKRQKRVVGGTAVTYHKYPWIVLIHSWYAPDSNLNDLRTGACTGSIIDVYGTVITAAHCVDPEQNGTVNGKVDQVKLRYVVIKWGSYLVHANDAGHENITDLSRIHLHHDAWSVHRSPNAMNIDVALIYLNEFEKNPTHKQLHPKAKPIQLSSKGDQAFEDPHDGSFAGFGCQPITNEDNVIIGCIPEANLTEQTIRFRVKAQVTSVAVERFFLCALIDTPAFLGSASMSDEEVPFNGTTKMRYNGPCSGDSGGPYMVHENGSIVLRGVYSGEAIPHGSQEPYCRAFASIIFMDVDYDITREWIEDKLRLRYTILTSTNYTGNVPIVRRVSKV